MQHSDVVFVIGNLRVGGAQTVLASVATALVDRGLDVLVLVLVESRGEVVELDSRVACRVVGPVDGGAFGANLARIRHLRSALRSADPQVVMGFMTSTNVLTILAAAGLSCRVVVSERNDPSRQRAGRPWELARRLLYRFADVVSANSRGALDAMRRYVPASRLRYLPNPLPAVPDLEVTHREAALLTVGRLTHQKGHDVLLAALARAAPQLGSWRLRVAGSGDLDRSLCRLADELGVSSRIDWLGHVRDVAEHYRSASVFVLPSRFEGTPNALLEAMAHGLPPIVTDASPGPLEYVQDGVTGLVVPVEDPAALAAALVRLVEDDALRRRLGRAARSALAEAAGGEVLEDWLDILGVQAGTSDDLASGR